MDRQQRLVAALASAVPSLDGRLGDAVSLVRSGLVDSLGLLTIATFVEEEIGRPVDGIEFDPEREWDTIAAILKFIQANGGRAE